MKFFLYLLFHAASPLASAFLPIGPSNRVKSPPPAQTTLFSSATATTTGKFSNEDLETAFFSIDVDATGSIPRSSFADALADLGVELPESQTDELFDRYDEDKGGSIDFNEFKALMADEKLAGVKPNRDVKFAMDLFKNFDADASGNIDKTEFRAIAKEIQADARRRNLISVAVRRCAHVVVSLHALLCMLISFFIFNLTPNRLQPLER